MTLKDVAHIVILILCGAFENVFIQIVTFEFVKMNWDEEKLVILLKCKSVVTFIKN